MQQRYGMGLFLAVILSVSGCCCPMTCAPMMCQPVNCCPQVSWTERMEDMYCDFSDKMHRQSCHLQHKMSCTMRQLGSNLGNLGNGMTSNCNCQSQGQDYGYGQSYSQNYGHDHYGHDHGQNDYAEMPVSAKVPPASTYRERAPRGQRRRCSRCRQSPCRCGHCEGCDGFESANSYAPANGGGYDAGSHPEQYESLPPTMPAPTYQEPTPVPAVPNPGPTPIYKTPQPVGPTTSTSIPATTNVAAVTPAPRSLVSPIDISIAEDESLKLKPISFTTHAPLTKSDGWQPTPSASRPAR
ncbi:MAG: hypothetical protein V4719_09595 [Planctomycetota bacterium]